MEGQACGKCFPWKKPDLRGVQTSGGRCKGEKDRIPSFTFSKRVHKHIERDMAKTMIIKLMGRRTAFHMLLGKI
ncbi:hypothetical protein PVK06_048023 [Gossypium arboreum]|uniref:Uncharacterized protein n=1 Tax=Gossypium arboreum TaxID=29729 RepID=A0ABR0MEU4_GOSAR|nr:hypothetical protein PVK06_048023 [Gossypium arboreum]